MESVVKKGMIERPEDKRAPASRRVNRLCEIHSAIVRYFTFLIEKTMLKIKNRMLLMAKMSPMIGYTQLTFFFPCHKKTSIVIIYILPDNGAFL